MSSIAVQITNFMLEWDLKPGLLASAWNPLLESVKDLIDNTGLSAENVYFTLMGVTGSIRLAFALL